MLELTENRVYRTYIGGKLLDEFANKPDPKDTMYPERWICSTTAVGGDTQNTGVSKTTDGTLVTELIKPIDILFKLLDSYTRLSIQVHPDDELAQKYFDSKYGKTEAWYVFGTRVVNGEQPYVYLGFKEGITRKKWEEVYLKQDIEEMQNLLHKIPVKPGDIFYIPAKLPHAMGCGVFFAEVQQPTDITLRTERFSPDGRELSDYDLTHGASLEAMFDCFEYDGRSLDKILETYRLEKQGETILDTPLFSMYEIDVEDSRIIEAKPYAVVIVLEGEDKGREFYLDADYEFKGKQKLLVCYGKK